MFAFSTFLLITALVLWRPPWFDKALLCLPLAFALVGILAGIRVKTELNSKSDSHFTFASIGVGLAIGAGYLTIALVLATFFSLTMLIVTPVATSYRTEI
jgi:hypothetical protein